MVSSDDFMAFTAAELTELRTAYKACLLAIATAGQSYTIAGRQFNRANLAEVRETLSAITQAQERQSGEQPSQTFMRVT